MDQASYTQTTTSSGGVGKYPLSTESLDFIQQQILLLESLACIGGGSNYILKMPQGNTPGVAVINYAPDKAFPDEKRTEIILISNYPEFSRKTPYLTVMTSKIDVVADGETYIKARTIRKAQFTGWQGEESYPVANFMNVSGLTVSKFPTNLAMAEQIKQLPKTILRSLADVLAEKLTAKTVTGLTQKQMDALKTTCIISCQESVKLFGFTNYTIETRQQGSNIIRQELTLGNDQHYVRIFKGNEWGEWEHRIDTIMHLDIKISRNTVYVRHGALDKDCDIVLVRKKRRSAWRRTGGKNAYSNNRGIRTKRLPKSQFVHFKGIILSKGTPGKWYVPKCLAVADKVRDHYLIGKELPTLCKSLFFHGQGDFYYIQGCRKPLVLKSSEKADYFRHSGYANIGLQIARVKSTGSKDSGGEIVRMKYRITQEKSRDNNDETVYTWVRRFSIE